jgi:hypothetical protein
LTLSGDRGGAAVLRDLDVLVVPDGDVEAVAKWLADRDVRSFMERGGRVVAVKGAAEAVGRLVPKALQPVTVADTLQAFHGPLVRLHAPRGRTWISYGTSETPTLSARMRRIWSSADADVLLSFGDTEPLSGELPRDKRAVLVEKTFAAAIGVGTGGMVLLADDPSFRAASPGMWRTLANAVLLAPAFVE